MRTNALNKYLLLIVLTISVSALNSCATSIQKSSEKDTIQPDANKVELTSQSGVSQFAEPVDDAVVEKNDDDDDDQDPISALDDAEFCKDNIYAQYLKNKYLREHPKAVNPEQAFKLGRNSKRRRAPTHSPYNQREIEALFFARTRMVGETVPYFGAMPVVTNPRVEHWIRFFKNAGRKSFLKWLIRGESVRSLVLPILKEQGLPPEFIFLSMVESGFSNQAYSQAKATGPWQFMPGTAKLYGLEMNMFKDERRDPAKSTLAAARHLSDLYDEFGDWYLAMAAYNAGAGRVRNAIKMTGSNDFWKLADSAYLPVETKNYVPKVLAALQLASNPAGHGFEVQADPSDVLPVSTIPLKGPVQLAELAEKLGRPEHLIRRWNPELINAVTPPLSRDVESYPLRVASELIEKWTDIEKTLNFVEIKDVIIHKIRPGETLRMIAARYRVNAKRILSLNPGLKPTHLKVGTQVAVPASLIVPKNRASRVSKAKRDNLRG